MALREPDPFLERIQKKEELFEDSYLYIGFSSYSGCSINLRVSAQKARNDLNKIKLEQHRLAREKMFREVKSFFTINEPFYREMLAKEDQIRENIRLRKQKMLDIGLANLYYKTNE